MEKEREDMQKEIGEQLERMSFTATCDTAPDNCWKTYRVMTIDVWEKLIKALKSGTFSKA